jgi:hypothetical protein
MRERAQASVETIALTAAALALAAALLLGVVRLAPPLASVIGRAVSGVLTPGTPTAPGLDALERALLDGATSTDVDAPTLLDLRSHLRARLDGPSAEAAFTATLRQLVARALSGHSVDTAPDDIGVVDRATEDAWLRDRFHPGRLREIAELAIGFAGIPGTVYSLADDLGLTKHEPADAIDPGRAAGDIVVFFRHGLRRIVLRRTPGRGLAVVADDGLGRRNVPG